MAQVSFDGSAVPGGRVSRRSLLRGAAAGAGAVALPAVLAACGSGPGGDGRTIRLGSNSSDPVPKKAFAAAFAAYEKQSKEGRKVKVNTVDHNTFQENINRYLQGKPDDVFMWFAGYRMQFFAKKGLLHDISDIWGSYEGFSPALKAQSTGEDGKQYLTPYYYYPWAVFHRRSVFEERGYQAPGTLDEYIALARQMQKDKLVPIAFCDKDGWPAMGTFDYINMRTNGYEFHRRLMAGEEAWTSNEVRQVFDTWRSLLPYCQPAANGRTWQEAATSLQKKQAGMAVFGLPHPGQQFPEEEQDDIDFFPFPVINPEHGQDAVEAPIDGFLLAKKSKSLKQDKVMESAKDLLKWLSTGEAEDIYLAGDPNNIAVSDRADTSKYTALQKKAVELVSGAKQISQFLDRDTRPDFSSVVMIPAIQSFINDPKDVDGLVNGIERQKKTIFAAD
ncbi:ABC transporter substrate-binding protein [Streptomyces pristinaespiralis]|uniref:Extracellular solute-binding protein family 1 n=2 Tax=Streptomyces pristinaespiralis TaxID=38300 RepID=B5HCY2_STRE2|nr:ABC transporter substrate-binding protein [Streptomyces pristinaespiralis]ALC24719.1 extracellular solute-binding protein family 1 [Streptomyces pristinaespiralis]EDY64705.1 extracellular solute-binding protein family 1 [Streptomyces pristinaespiralis ATCC 25486]QMU12960.1 carbohydrate ABC transporter substrate-binding protein [Streptomyces pristinaespiralis]